MSRLFDSIVGWKRGTESASFMACVLDGGFDEPLADGFSMSERRSVTVSVKMRGDGAWNRTDAPKIGDRITFADGDYAVSNVRKFSNSEWIMEARSC